MKNFEFFFDVDDVLKPLAKPWIQVIKANLGIDIKYEDVTSFKTLGQPEYLNLLRPEYFDHSVGKPVDGALEVVTTLRERGYKVYTLSSTHYENVGQKGEWLERVLGFAPNEIMWTHQKGLLGGHFMRVLVDDGTHNLEEWREAGGFAICLDRPWNQDWDGVRIKDLRELIEAGGFQ